MNSGIQIGITIKHFAKNGTFEGKELFVFGVNGFTASIYRSLLDIGYRLTSAIDNNINKQGNEISGLRVLSPESALRPFNDNARILIASKYYDEMSVQLESMGYIRSKHIMKLLDIDSIDGPDFISEQLVEYGVDSAKRGLRIYIDLCKNMRDSFIVFLCPVSSIGDIFLLGLYFNKYLEKISSAEHVLLIPGRAGTEVAESYGIENIVTISQADATDLISFKMLIGSERCDIRVLHSGYLHQRIVCNIIMHRNMTWLENYRQFLFGFNKNEHFQRRKINRDPSIARHLLDESGLIPKKTVILSPYAQTVAALSDVFWVNLARTLKHKGFCVCTNVIGAEREIEGTVPLSFSLDIAEAVLEQAGYFIALRSGLCDVVSMATCKKIILYTQEVFECIKVIEFYSINKMGLCNNAIEIEVTHDRESDIEAVIKALCDEVDTDG